MLGTVASIIAAVGGLIIAGVSAYAAYKKSTNHGSHTLTTSYAGYSGGYYGNGYNNTAYANTNYGYGYGYSNPTVPTVPTTPTTPVPPVTTYTQPVQPTGSVNVDLSAVINKVNELVIQINRISQIVADTIARVNSIYAARANAVPAAPVPTASVPEVIDVVTWEESGDEAVVKVNNGINPAEDTPVPTMLPAITSTPVVRPTHTHTNPVVSNMGMAALNCKYSFDMNRGFEQFYDSDLYRRITQDRQNSVYIPTAYPPQMCEMPDPYNGLPVEITGGVSYDVNPYLPAPVYPSLQAPVVHKEEPERPKPLVFHYGHIGEAFPSTRQSYPYGYNI